MLHIVPILCLIFFIIFVEYRLKEHIEKNDKLLEDVTTEYALQKTEIIKLNNKLNALINEGVPYK